MSDVLRIGSVGTHHTTPSPSFSGLNIVGEDARQNAAEETEEPDEGDDDDALDDEIVDQWAQHPAMSEVNA